MPPRIGLLSRGDRHAGGQSALAETRLAPLVRAFADMDVAVEPVVYSDDAVTEVRNQLLGLDGVLVWVNPVQDGADRSRLDALLREVAGHAVWVSAHPDVILRMGTKEVLFTTRSLGWGTDIELYRSMQEFTQRFPARLDQHRVLVLKQGRGTGGTGVWKVELTEPRIGSEPGDHSGLDALVRVQHAETKDSATDEMPLAEFLERCRGYFAWSGFLVDQPFQERLEALLFGPATDTGADSYVLCEINVSAVWPYPQQAATTIAAAALSRARTTIASRG
jgi:hypothetical protein